MNLQNPNRKHSTQRVFEAIDVDEYDALHPKKKTIVNLILSAEYVDLTEDGKTRQILWDYFPIGTVTRGNLEDLEQWIHYGCLDVGVCV